MSHKKKANEPQIETCDICGDCGTELGTPHEFPVTYWNGKCDYCERRGTVTSVRDFDYPDYKDMTDAWDKPLDCIPQLDHNGRKLLGAIADVDKMVEDERIVDTNKTIQAQDRFAKSYCAKMNCGNFAVARIKNAWWCEEHFHDWEGNTENTTIECEKEKDGSLSLHIPDGLVKKIVQAFMENTLYEMVRENEQLSKDKK